MKLDAKTVAALELPAGKLDTIFFDDEVAGFGLRLRAGGHRSWITQYRSSGRTRRLTIGSPAKLSLPAARKAARDVLAKVLLGEDPQGDKARARLASARTLRSVVDMYLAARAAELRPAS